MDPFNKHHLATGKLKWEYIIMSNVSYHQLCMHAEVITIIQLPTDIKSTILSYSLYSNMEHRVSMIILPYLK